VSTKGINKSKTPKAEVIVNQKKTTPLSKAVKSHQEFMVHWKQLEESVQEFDVTEIRERLIWLHLSPDKSNPKSQRRCLLSKYKKFCQRIFSENSSMARQFRNNMGRGHRNKYHFDYLVVIDFEATCEIHNPDDFQHEIIQFPAVLIDVHRQEIVDEFNSYCKPRINPTLSSFCMSLTGIPQETVDSARDFTDVLEDFTKWLESHGLGTKHTFSLVADGFCDMGKFLYTQCMLSGVNYPSFALQWIDIRLLFFHFYGVKWYKLPITLELLGERFRGTLHNGLDDSRNIGAVLLKIIKGGANPIQNERIILDHQEQESNAPSHKYDLRTVKYIHPREFFASQGGSKGYSGGRIRTWSYQQAQEAAYNKENWQNATNGLVLYSGSPPGRPTFFPSPPPVPRVNKLNLALRNSYNKQNTDEESASLKPEKVVVPRRMTKSEPSTLVSTM